MTTTRALAVAAALAGVLLASGCGDSKKCNDAVPPVKQTPAACTAVAGTALTVPVNNCPRCDQATPSCDVRAVGGGRFALELVAQVCDPNSSCEIPNLSSCAALATNCTLTAALTNGLDPAQSYFLDIYTDVGVVEKPLTIVASGSPACTY